MEMEVLVLPFGAATAGRRRAARMVGRAGGVQVKVVRGRGVEGVVKMEGGRREDWRC